ncbi:MAG: HAMP domain-containing sensor histidine kinase [Planctomycetota bacterium]
MLRGLSLAQKSGLLFGSATVVLVVVALAFPWVRLERTVDRGEIATAREIASLWEDALLVSPELLRVLRSAREAEPVDESAAPGVEITFYPGPAWTELVEIKAGTDEFVAGADDSLALGSSEFVEVDPQGSERVYRLARRIEGEPASGVLVVSRRSATAQSQLFVDRAYLVVAAAVAVIVSVVVLFVLVRRVVLEPVDLLHRAADAARRGRLHLRLKLRTGDEFEELGDTFNQMLSTIEEKQGQLRAMNRSLDLRLNELAERNVSLFESARLKGDFVASVSHELRTPLNSIIGFAEILQDILHQESAELTEQEETPRSLERRRRYLENIVTAGRTLLEMINELLTIAKIDAGTVEVHIAPLDPAELCEALVTLISPLAERKQVHLELQLGTGPQGGPLPPLETDGQKLQQIVFNFLSNAVKFTPSRGSVTLRCESVLGADGMRRARFGVLDTGPGIPPDKQAAIFERFHQIDSGVAREHPGTGLGLAIAKEFADLLGGEITLESAVGRGSVFSLIVPDRFEGSAPRGGDVARTAATTER